MTNSTTISRDSNSRKPTFSHHRTLIFHNQLGPSGYAEETYFLLHSHTQVLLVGS